MDLCFSELLEQVERGEVLGGEEERYCSFNPYISTEDGGWLQRLYSALYPLPRSLRHYETFCIIILNLALRRESVYLQIHKGAYTGIKMPAEFLPSGISEICNTLHRAGYIILEKGFNVPGGVKKTTTIAPTKDLLELIPEELSLIYRREGLIVTKEFSPTEYPDDVLEREEVLERYNHTVEPENWLYATYKGSFEVDGRMHGSSVITMSKQQRRYVLIDGEETVELDISSCIPHLLYATELKREVPKEIYRLPGAPREIVKKAIVIALNCESREAARSAIQSRINIGQWKNLHYTASQLLDAIEAKHPELKEYLYKGLGRKLMNAESLCMTRFMRRMLDMGIKHYPIYDSVRVPVSRDKEVEEELRRAFTINGFTPPHS